MKKPELNIDENGAFITISNGHKVIDIKTLFNHVPENFKFGGHVNTKGGNLRLIFEKTL